MSLSGYSRILRAYSIGHSSAKISAVWHNPEWTPMVRALAPRNARAAGERSRPGASSRSGAAVRPALAQAGGEGHRPSVRRSCRDQSVAWRTLLRRQARLLPGNRPDENMLALKVTTIGSSAGVVLPKEALARLRVKKGDRLFLVETPNGYELVPYDPEFRQQLEAAEEGMHRYRNALRQLAKQR